MLLEQDWLMRRIETLVRLAARLFWGKDAVTYEIADDQPCGETDLLHRELLELLARGAFCEAEDALFDQMRWKTEQELLLAVDFYQRLNRFSDQELEAHDFSREEIDQGLREVLDRFGIPLPEGV